MPFVVQLTSPSGEVYFGSAPDREGLRYRVKCAGDAEKFESKEKAEAVFYWLKQIRDISDYNFKTIELG